MNYKDKLSTNAKRDPSNDSQSADSPERQRAKPPLKPSPYSCPSKEPKPRKRTGGPRKWISAPESGPVNYRGEPKREKLSSTGSPCEIWDLGFRFSPDIYNEIRDSRFGLLIPVFESFEINENGAQKNVPQSDAHDEKGKTYHIYILVPSRFCLSSVPSISAGSSASSSTLVHSQISPAALSALFSLHGVRHKWKVLAETLICLDAMYRYTKSSFRDARMGLNPSLRRSFRSFETTKDIFACYVRRVYFTKDLERKTKTTTLGSFLLEIGVFKLIKAHDNRGIRIGTTYEFPKGRFKEYEIAVDPNWIAKIERNRDGVFDDYENNPLWRIFVDGVSEISLDPEILETLNEYSSVDEDGRIKHYGDVYKYNKGDSYPLRQRSSVYFSKFNGMPSMFRVLLKDVNGEYRALVDIRSAYATFLHDEISKIIKYAKSKGREVQEAERDLAQFGKDINSKELYRKIGKKAFNKLLNVFGGAKKPKKKSEEAAKDIENLFAKMYPGILSIFKNLKKRHKNKLYHLLQGRVSALMEEAVLFCKENWGFNAVILGDELIVPESYRYEVKDLMQELVFKHAEFKGSIKVTTREGEESFMHPDLVPESSNPNPIIDGRCDLKAKCTTCAPLRSRGWLQR